MKKKYFVLMNYAVYALVLALAALLLVWAVNSGKLGFITKDTPERDEFKFETEQNIIDDLLNEGDVSAIAQNEYDKYIKSLPVATDKIYSEYVAGKTVVALDMSYKSFTDTENRKMPVITTDAILPAGYSCAGGEDGILLLNRGGKYGYYTETGHWITQPEYSVAYAFSGGVAVVRYGEHYGVVDKEGNQVIPFLFDSITDMDGTGMTAYRRGDGYVRIVFAEKG